MRLPIIDISPLLAEDVSISSQIRAETCLQLHEASLNYGFFYLDISAFVSPSEPEELARLAKTFFGLSQEQKDSLALKRSDGARGYARLNQNITNGKADAHEGIDWYKPVENSDRKKPLWGENQWPDENVGELDGFRAKYEKWVDKMKELGMIIMKAMAQGLGMTPQETEGLLAQVDDSFWVMRAIGYPPLPSDHDGFSCGAHKDYGCLTFLWADPTPSALQVFLQSSHNALRSLPSANNSVVQLPDEQGGEEGVWIDADPIPGCIVCNIGEMWEIWTDGLYKSTLHRVVHRGDNYRVSIPFFFEPNFDALVEPLPAALRLKAKLQGGPDSSSTRAPVKYGDFLLAKVGNNFVVEGDGTDSEAQRTP